MVNLKRAYEPPIKSDGQRILVDRLWPRGLSKEAGRIDIWLKDIAPSSQLRTWFAHDASKWLDFEQRYIAELASNAAVIQLRDLLADQPSTLIYAAKDTKHNHALVLKHYLEANERPHS